MPRIKVRDPKTGELLGITDDEKCTTEISESWSARKAEDKQDTDREETEEDDDGKDDAGSC